MSRVNHSWFPLPRPQIYVGNDFSQGTLGWSQPSNDILSPLWLHTSPWSPVYPNVLRGHWPYKICITTCIRSFFILKDLWSTSPQWESQMRQLDDKNMRQGDLGCLMSAALTVFFSYIIFNSINVIEFSRMQEVTEMKRKQIDG